jgi:hypothetical protein
MLPAEVSAMALPLSMGQRHSTSGYATPLLPVIVFPVGLQVLAAHSAYSPSHTVKLPPADAAEPSIARANIVKSFFILTDPLKHLFIDQDLVLCKCKNSHVKYKHNKKI